MSEMIIRDPVHDVIAFRMDRPTDALLFHLINCAEFQRLRRIRQLGLTSLAYPGAEHTRYSHSIGVMETARKMLAQLQTEASLNEAEMTACLAAALLHDLGHGPFSHVFERVSGIDHETVSVQLIMDSSTEVHRTLAGHDARQPRRVANLLHGKRQGIFSDILSSQLDADRLDYLLRDNLHTGARYGGYDLNWLIHALTIDRGHQRLAIDSKGVSAVESYLQARYHMYRNVYFHKVVRSAEGMVKLVLQRARELTADGKLLWMPQDEPVRLALTGTMLEPARFTELDDVSVVSCFKTWMANADRILSGLSRGILFRQIYRPVDLSSDADRQAIATAVDQAGRAIAVAGGCPQYDLFYDEPKDTPYETYSEEGTPLETEIMVRCGNDEVRPLTSISPLPEALNRQLRFRRVYVNPLYSKVVTQAVEQAIERSGIPLFANQGGE